MQSTTIPASVAAALVKAQRAIRPVGKDSTNKFHGYDYASAEAIITEAREALSGADLAVLAESWELYPGDPATVTVTWLVVHAGGDTLVGSTRTPVIPEKGRPLDKALSAALTVAESYFLRSLLLIPRVDAEVDQRDDRQHVPGASKAAAKGVAGGDKPTTKNGAQAAAGEAQDTSAVLASYASKYAMPFDKVLQYLRDNLGGRKVADLNQGELREVCGWIKSAAKPKASTETPAEVAA